MFGKSLSANLVALLVTIGILPGGKSRALDRAKLIFWIITVTVIVAYWQLGSSYLNFLDDLVIQFNGVESLMEFVVFCILPTLRMLGTILAFSTAWTRYPNLLTDNKIPAPSMPWFLPAVVMFITIDQALAIWKQATWYQDIGKLMPSLVGGMTYHTLNIISAFVIGVCVAKFKKNIQVKEDISDIVTANACGIKNVREMQALKHFLSPLLFILIITNGLGFIFRSYWALYKFPGFGHISGIIYRLLIIAYVSIIIQSCFKEFKLKAKCLR